MTMPLSRRRFLTHTAAVTAGFAGLRSFTGQSGSSALAQASDDAGFGPLIKDPKRILDLPAGFSYSIISRKGEVMDDGFYVPAKHDGMATFPGPDGLTLIVRNHEITGPNNKLGPFGRNGELFGKVPLSKVYDSSYAVGAIAGGTTTLVYDTKQQKLVRHYLSLVGTDHNCAGGPTPWGSWISCEESVAPINDIYEEEHGYNFEVPATAEINLTKPVPLKAMGRFNHEAIAVDPNSGIIYQTEDRQDGVLYRFIPKVPGKLAEGGRLQFLAVKDRPSLDLRNWKKVDTKKLQSGGAHDTEFEGDGTLNDNTPVGKKYEIYWQDIDNVEAPKDDLRYRAFKAGAARFARNEGMWYGNDAVYFASTTGGHNAKGQIWRYTPSPNEGTDKEKDTPATLELFIEPNDKSVLQHADNLCVSHFGDIIVCEDGGPVNHVLGVTPQGQVYKLGRNTMNKSEFAGGCFSPDGSTLFVNIQNPGLTLAVTGPWTG
ncbi:MAG: alkaline phosphatase PhoX [Phycisphaeraceae bacterium]